MDSNQIARYLVIIGVILTIISAIILGLSGFLIMGSGYENYRFIAGIAYLIVAIIFLIWRPTGTAGRIILIILSILIIITAITFVEVYASTAALGAILCLIGFIIPLFMKPAE